MAKKKDICFTCKKFDGLYCNEEAKKEIIIKNRKETIVNYKPNKETECNYYEDINADAVTES